MEVNRTEKITFRCTALEKAALAEQAAWLYWFTFYLELLVFLYLQDFQEDLEFSLTIPAVTSSDFFSPHW